MPSANPKDRACPRAEFDVGTLPSRLICPAGGFDKGDVIPSIRCDEEPEAALRDDSAHGTDETNETHVAHGSDKGIRTLVAERSGR